MTQAYCVTFECVSSSNVGWGRKGGRIKIAFTEYDVVKFQQQAPGGWIIREIVPGYLDDHRFIEGTLPLVED